VNVRLPCHRFLFARIVLSAACGNQGEKLYFALGIGSHV